MYGKDLLRRVVHHEGRGGTLRAATATTAAAADRLAAETSRQACRWRYQRAAAHRRHAAVARASRGIAAAVAVARPRGLLRDHQGTAAGTGAGPVEAVAAMAAGRR